MKLFSKRYSSELVKRSMPNRLYSREYSRVYTSQIMDDKNTDDDRDKFLPSTLRTRLEQELKFIVTSNECFLEPFLIVDDKQLKTKYFHTDTLKDLSLRELGYDITKYYRTDLHQFGSNCKDLYIFDLIELIIIFIQSQKRELVVGKFNRIFKEEGEYFEIYNFMIIMSKESDIRAIITLIEDDILKNKLIKLYSYSRLDSQTQAKISAELLQYIFSSKTKGDTKKYTEALCKQLAQKYTIPEKVIDLEKMINETVKNAKNLSNNIADIRHTDKHTIPIGSGDLYKLISINNMQLVELVILTFPEKYITSNSPEQIKSTYLREYGLESTGGWIRKSTEDMLPEIDLDEIPF